MLDPYPIDGAGKIHVPEGPGLGIEIDWDAVDRETYWSTEVRA
jgi:L-alanine-DL-glutamate epimerase-like enolase superfamily enzyme